MVVALQLYTVRDQTAQDFTGTLRKVAQMGYTAVEFAGYGGLSASELKALLNELGLKAVATHLGPDLLAHNLDNEIAYCLEIGCPNLVLPWLPEDQRTIDGYNKVAQLLNTVGQHCHEHGLTAAYHNHDFEFKQENGTYFLDILLNATDPTLVKLELDTFWAAYGGVDPIAYIHAHADRIALVHLKDMTAERKFTEVGDGTLDTRGIIEAGQAAGVQAFVVENDAPSIPSLESARRSLENLGKLLG